APPPLVRVLALRLPCDGDDYPATGLQALLSYPSPKLKKMTVVSTCTCWPSIFGRLPSLLRECQSLGAYEGLAGDSKSQMEKVLELLRGVKSLSIRSPSFAFDDDLQEPGPTKEEAEGLAAVICQTLPNLDSLSIEHHGDDSAAIPHLLTAMASNSAQPVKLKDLDLPYLSPVSSQLLKSIACHSVKSIFLMTMHPNQVQTRALQACTHMHIGFLPGSDGSLATSWRLPSLTHLSIHYIPISEVPYLLQADLPSLSCCVLMIYPDTDDETEVFLSPQDALRLKKQLRALRTLGAGFKLGRPGPWQWHMARGNQKLVLGKSLEALVSRQKEVRDTFSGCPEPVALVGALEGEEATLNNMGI
ncbi:hypothetical protein DUNSADRAFT_175, partial [Dunaliella salina]